MRSISTCTFTGHVPVPGPSGSLRLFKSAVLPICHLLVLDGVYRREGEDRLQFVSVPAPTTEKLKRLVQRIAARVGRSLEHSGLITRDIDNAYLAFDPSDEAPIHGLLGASITYRIATGPREGQKVFTLQTLPAEAAGP